VVVAAGCGIVIGLGLGEVLRIEQITDGQCVDVNVFARSPSRLRFSAARTRMAHGINPSNGATLWSTPPETPLMRIVADSAPSHDLVFPACSAFEYEQATGVPGHPSCAAIQARAQSLAGLSGGTEAHDPLNLWLPSAVDGAGSLHSWPVAARRGDHVELLALREVLVCINPCPDDIFGSSQYEPGPVRVIVRGGGEVVAATQPPAPPAPLHELTVEVADELHRHVVDVRQRGWLGFSDSAVVRALLFRWWESSASSATSS
jgi:uncharacterized protein YcgI (DUF1989 family)